MEFNKPWSIKGFAGQHDEAGALIVDANGKTIASTYGGLRSGSSSEEWQRYYKVAHLIAAAPEMLEVLERVYAASTKRGSELSKAIEAVISKAKQTQ
jgi:hypothetical protein